MIPQSSQLNAVLPQMDGGKHWVQEESKINSQLFLHPKYEANNPENTNGAF